MTSDLDLNMKLCHRGHQCSHKIVTYVYYKVKVKGQDLRNYPEKLLKRLLLSQNVHKMFTLSFKEVVGGSSIRYGLVLVQFVHCKYDVICAIESKCLYFTQPPYLDIALKTYKAAIPCIDKQPMLLIHVIEALNDVRILKLHS